MESIWFLVLINVLTAVSGKVRISSNSNDHSVIVKTSNGLVRGKLMETFNENKHYHAFLQIPFAKSPVKDRRFKVSEPSDRWSGIYDATTEGDQCVQYGPNNTIVGSEDCLFLHVYTPKRHDMNDDLLPVMYYVHGGGFMTGSARFDDYGPDLFMEKGVVLALVQYRLGIYGFLSTEDIICPGNNGLKDQRLGLKWIKENSKAFGGDPDKITIFGHSAGGASIGYLVDTPTTTGLFRAAIQQSAAEIAFWARQFQARKRAFQIGSRVGVSASNSKELIEKLKKVDYKKLYNAASSIATKISHGNPATELYAPIIELEHPEAMLTLKPLQQLQNSAYNRVPMILGFTSLEAEEVTLMGIVNYTKAQMKSNIAILLPNTIVPKDNATTMSIAKQIKEYYFGRNDFDYGALRYVSDDAIVRPVLQKSRVISKWSPTYLYKFSYIGALGDPTNPNRRGVAHAEELCYMFHNTNEPKEVSEGDSRIRLQLVTMWTNFAKTLNPTPDTQQLLDNVKWPKLSDKTDYQSLSIDKKLSIKKRVNEADLKFWQKMFSYDTAHIGWF